jgi:hypothetical protein
VHDGTVVNSVDPGDGKAAEPLAYTKEIDIRPTRSGWIAARAIYRNVHDGHLRQAHTSPIYIEIDSKPTASRKDAEYMIRWIDRLMRVSSEAGRYDSDEDRQVAQDLFRQARDNYEQVARIAREVWGN